MNNRLTRKCPVCDRLAFTELVELFDICDCGWQDDATAYENQSIRGGANKMSLNEAKEAYARGEQIQ